MKYFDVKPKWKKVNFRQIGEEEEVTMCGFRSDKEMFWASFALILLPVIMAFFQWITYYL